MTDRNTSQSIYTSQSIRKRIYTYNIWMILLAAAICVVVCGGCLGIYWEHQERVLEASARAELGDAAEEFIKSITVRSQGFYVTALLAVMFCIVAMTIVSRIYAEILVSRYEEAREELVAGVSHELRTPMTVIQGAIRSILDGVVTEPARQRVLLEMAYRRSEDMDRILTGLIDSSRAHAHGETTEADAAPHVPASASEQAGTVHSVEGK